MRVRVIGDGDCARALRGLLRQAGFVEGFLFGLRVEIEEAAADHITLDSIDCPLERNILRHISLLWGKPILVDRPGGRVHSEREIRIVVPAGDEAAALAVERGVLRGLTDTLGDPRTRAPWWHQLFAL